MTAPTEAIVLPQPPALGRLLSQGPLASLVGVLEGHPGFGWTLKESRGLRLLSHKGMLPHLDAALVGQRSITAGCTEAELFERQQATILRVADLRALQQARPSSEVHHFEADELVFGEGDREWAAWRWPIPGEAQEGPPQWLFTVWLNRRVTAQPEEQLRQAQRQMHAQQMLIAEIRANPGTPEPWEGSPAHWDRAAEQFRQHLRREIDLSRREHRQLAVLLVEVDLQGLTPSAAQAALALVSRQLSTSVRAMDTVTPIGPARFGVLLSGAALTPAHARAEAVRRAADAQRVLDEGIDRSLQLSIGVAAFPHNARQLEDLIAAAESALAEAITAGGGRSVVARVALGEPPEA